MQQVITANRLRDGVVVFYAGDRQWSEQLGDATVYPTAPEATTALADAQKDDAANLVLDVYAVDVVERDGRFRPVRLREAIRAEGPTIHPEHGKSASGTQPDAAVA